MIRQTGGRASAATSTRSRDAWLAISCAWARGTTPRFSPSASISRTDSARIASLIRVDGPAGGRVSGPRLGGKRHPSSRVGDVGEVLYQEVISRLRGVGD